MKIFDILLENRQEIETALWLLNKGLGDIVKQSYQDYDEELLTKLKNL
jgi:hypothetical protein